MNAILQLDVIQTYEVIEVQCLRFTLTRDHYLPYAELKAEFISEAFGHGFPRHAKFYLDDMLLFEGLADHVKIVKKNGRKLVAISAKSYSAALLDNQPTPGIYPNATLSSLMSLYHLPYITYQQNVNQSNYVYVKDNTSMWEMLIHYTYKLNGGFPYIEGNNHVRVTRHSQPRLFEIQPEEIISCGTQHDNSRVISRIEMADAAGNYGTFSMNNPYAEERNIVRIKQIALDKQYLSHPEYALTHRIYRSMQKIRTTYAEYLGYKGEDLQDHVCFIGFSGGYADRIEIRGEQGRLSTKVYHYHDPFCNCITTPPNSDR